MTGSDSTSTVRSRRLTTAGLIAVTAATLLMMAWAIFPTGKAQANDGCPHTADRVDHPGASGSYTQGSVTVSWSGSTVTVSGGTATFCVKAGQGTAFMTLTNASFTLTCPTFCNNQGQVQQISHISSYNPPPTTTTSSTTATTTSSTTATTSSTTASSTTPPGGTTTTTDTPTVSPTTVTPSETTDVPTVNPTTVQPGGTAFTGVEEVVPIGALALTLLTTGSGLLWAGARKRRNGTDDQS